MLTFIQYIYENCYDEWDLIFSQLNEEEEHDVPFSKRVVYNDNSVNSTDHTHEFKTPDGTEGKVVIKADHNKLTNKTTHYVDYSIKNPETGKYTYNISGSRPKSAFSVKKHVTKALMSYIDKNISEKPGSHSLFAYPYDDDPRKMYKKETLQSKAFRRIAKRYGGTVYRGMNSIRLSFPENNKA